MKAIVLEYKDGEAAVLREDGVVVKIHRECSVGEEIELPDEKKKTVTFGAGVRRLAVAAAVVLVVLGGTYNYTTVQAASYVTVEGNASVEYVLNRRGQVIAVNGLNDAGKDLQQKFEESDKRRCTLTEAMEWVGDVNEDTAYSVVSKNDHMRESIMKEVETWADQNRKPESTKEPEIYEGTVEDRDAAQREGESTEQYLKEKQQTMQETEAGLTQSEPMQGESNQGEGASKNNSGEGAASGQQDAQPNQEMQGQQEQMQQQEQTQGGTNP